MKNSDRKFSKLYTKHGEFKTTVDYLGLDTETIDGYCRVLCLSDDRVFRIENFLDVMKFLTEFMKARKTYFFAWNCDYDIQSLLKYFSQDDLDLLLKGIEFVIELPGMDKGFSIQYIKGKYLQFDGNYIFDAFQYYHTSLKEAAKKYLPEDEGKLEFDAASITEENIYSLEVELYCKRDALCVMKLYSLFHAALPEELKRAKPISNAFLSYNYFRSELSRNKPKPEINDYFRNSYHGGRFEIFNRGHFRNLYVYDINSAYPFEISNLRSLERAHYCNFAGYLKEATYSVLKVRVTIMDKFVSPVLVTEKGLCVYPVGTVEAYITKGEYERIVEYDPVVLEGFHIYCGREYPFAEKIAKLYERKQNSGFPLPFKVILNSLYGKTGQATVKWIPVDDLAKETAVVDFVDQDGVSYVKFEDIAKSNFVYASEITARTRLRMYDLVKKYPKQIVMVQTDSVISTEALDIPLSNELGGWKLEKWDEAYLIGSGVYFYRKGAEWFGKFRGFNFKSDRVKPILAKILRAKGQKVQFDTLKRFSIQEARRLHDDELGNKILEVSRSLNLNFDRKRVWMGSWESGAQVKSKRIKSNAIYSNV